MKEISCPISEERFNQISHDGDRLLPGFGIAYSHSIWEVAELVFVKGMSYHEVHDNKVISIPEIVKSIEIAWNFIKEQNKLLMESSLTNLYFDTEFTELHQNTTLISLAINTDRGDTFYAEFTDYDPMQVTPWIVENVISKLRIKDDLVRYTSNEHKVTIEFRGDSVKVKDHLTRWLEEVAGGTSVLSSDGYHSFKYLNGDPKFRLVSDCMHYDMVLLLELWGGAMKAPSCIHYIPRDICTMFEERGIDPDISREEFSGVSSDNKHSSEHDANVIRACHAKLLNM